VEEEDWKNDRREVEDEGRKENLMFLKAFTGLADKTKTKLLLLTYLQLSCWDLCSAIFNELFKGVSVKEVQAMPFFLYQDWGKIQPGQFC
jgi:hypothetical protein